MAPRHGWYHMQEAKNERLWFKTNLKLCGLWFKLREYGRAQKILRELHKCDGLTCSISGCRGDARPLKILLRVTIHSTRNMYRTSAGAAERNERQA